MKYETFKRIKIYRDNYEIREYEWESLLKRGLGAKLELWNKTQDTLLGVMLVSLDKVREMEVVNSVTGPQSGQQYLMRAIKWNPIKENRDKTPEINFDAKKRLADEFFKKFPELRKKAQA